ncbi:MAG: M20 family metallo-hydrolase [Terrimicrobiaceae bacterium]
MGPVDITRLQREIDELAEITEVDPPAVTRVIYSEKDFAARERVKSLCLAAGLKLREDAVGNLFARWLGAEDSLPAIGTGSHIDAIPNAGRYDGVLGVLGGLEAIRSLQSAGFRPKRSIELIAFTSEEPTRFGIGCLGSRLMSGSLALENALALSDSEGRSLDSWLQSTPYQSKDRSTVCLAEGHYHAFVELHIEQGPVLERESVDIGAVTHIAAPAAYQVEITGQGGHAGGVLMPARHDALCGAAEFVLALESAAKSSGSPDTVATVGVLRVAPGAINSIPVRVDLTVDLRDIRLDTRSATWEAAQSALKKIASARGLTTSLSVINQDPPATCNPALVKATESAAEKRGFTCRRMISRAYHDSLFLARIAPTTMIFIPCRNGWSHRPDEYSSPQQIEKGVAVLADVLAQAAAE